jgi:hypothetical protein
MVPGSDSLFDSIGCYSAYPLGDSVKLRMIVLNTVVFTRSASLPYSSSAEKQHIDASAEMNWFHRQLKEADSLKESVLIAMHVPPGIDGYKRAQNTSDGIFWYDPNVQNGFLYSIDSFQRSRHSIVGLLASHTHMDGIRILRDSNGNTISLLLSVPAIAPGHGNNPAMKVIEYDPDKGFAFTDFTTYYMDVNGDYKTAVPWGKSFSFKKEFDSVNAGEPLVKYFESPDGKTVDRTKKFVNKIYGAPGKKDSNEVNATIYVDYRKE